MPDRAAPGLTTELDFPIVGIGASAGGLEAFKALLRALPTDTGMAFVFLQHSDPHYESKLAELLRRETSMKVREITDGMKAEPNHIFVVPADSRLALLHGAFNLMPRGEGSNGTLPIDYFFRSLAADRGRKAAAVVLSGTGNDGTRGMEEVKAQGGITLVQTERSAQFDGMPRSAIAAGVVDFTLAPADIARELATIGRHPYLTSTGLYAKSPDPLPGGEGDLQKIFILLRNSMGVDFSLYKDATIKRRIIRRMALHKLEQLKDYLRYLHAHPRELKQLYQDILISVTGFFRDPETFDALKKKVFPQLVKNRTSEPLRVWVAGCATGEEAYSIVIALTEYMEASKLRIPVQIFATDISDVATEKARAGLYSKTIADELSPERLRRFFHEEEGGYRMAKAIRELCVFAGHNVAADPPFSRIDLVTCRNVLIYLNQPLQKKVLSIFHYALKPKGYLMLGVSETVGSLSDLFASIDKKNKIYARKNTLAPLRFDFSPAAWRRRQPMGGSIPLPGAAIAPSPRDPLREADRIVLNRYSPAGIVVNSHLAIVQFRGDSSRFLEPMPGEASLNVLRMVRGGLHRDLHNLLHKAMRQRKTFRKEHVAIEIDQRTSWVNLEVIPLPDAGEPLYLVLFEEASANPRRTRKGEKRPVRDNSELAHLREELESNKEYLQSVIEEQEATNEELKSANEEIQSSNEELQSTNEEMETAKEELQSTNEELSTVNEELQNRNNELAQGNNDLNNLLSSVNVPIVMLGSDLRIRRYTPMAEKILNLIPTDIGRPISDIKTNISAAELDYWIARVLETLNPEEHEVQSHDGRWYAVMVRPYRTNDNRIEGVVIAFIDIERLKRSTEDLIDVREYVEAMTETVREPMLVLDVNMRVKSVTQAFCDTFKVARQDTIGRTIQELGDGQWNIAELRSLLGGVMGLGRPVKDFQVVHTFPQIGRRTVLVNARRIHSVGHKTQAILVTFADIRAVE